MAQPILALTMGDPAGIGLDLTAAVWAARAGNSCPPFVFFGDPDALRMRAAALAIPLSTALVSDPGEAAAHFDAALPIVPLPLAKVAQPGRTSSANAAAIIASIEQAAASVLTGTTSAIVTNPIAKATLYAAGFKHPGHTEFLGALATQHDPGKTCHPVMMLVSDDLRVVPLTVHVPLRDVPAAVTAPLIERTAKITTAALSRDFAIARPRITFAGLNPHAGEDGTIGREEIDIIAPAIARLKTQGLAVSGPHPGDTLFHEAARAGYDAVIAMYHDQALIPLKTLAFDRGVNVTLGLPFVRTSPDHGTAFDIAGSGRASPESLLAALRLAARLAKQRAEGRCA